MPYTIDAAGWLHPAKHVLSPNADARPAWATLDLIVLHNISLPPDEMQAHDIAAFFCNVLPVTRHPFYREIATLRVSAHVLIERDGAILQFVSFDRRAWHAGVSSYCGRSHCNDFSIGIELHGADRLPYTLRQYHSLAALIDCLWQRYPTLSPEALVGHCDIAPTRKSDPGISMNMPFLRSLLSRNADKRQRTAYHAPLCEHSPLNAKL